MNPDEVLRLRGIFDDMEPTIHDHVSVPSFQRLVETTSGFRMKKMKRLGTDKLVSVGLGSHLYTVTVMADPNRGGSNNPLMVKLTGGDGDMQECLFQPGSVDGGGFQSGERYSRQFTAALGIPTSLTYRVDGMDGFRPSKIDVCVDLGSGTLKWVGQKSKEAGKSKPAFGETDDFTGVTVPMVLDGVDAMIEDINMVDMLDPNDTGTISWDGFLTFYFFRKSFEMLDRQGDGNVSYKDFERGMERLPGLRKHIEGLRGGKPIRPYVTKRMFQSVDADGDGGIVWGEFLLLVKGSSLRREAMKAKARLQRTVPADVEKQRGLQREWRDFLKKNALEQQELGRHLVVPTIETAAIQSLPFGLPTILCPPKGLRTPLRSSTYAAPLTPYVAASGMAWRACFSDGVNDLITVVSEAAAAGQACLVSDQTFDDDTGDSLLASVIASSGKPFEIVDVSEGVSGEMPFDAEQKEGLALAVNRMVLSGGILVLHIGDVVSAGCLSIFSPALGCIRDLLQPGDDALERRPFVNPRHLPSGVAANTPGTRGGSHVISGGGFLPNVAKPMWSSFREGLPRRETLRYQIRTPRRAKLPPIAVVLVTTLGREKVTTTMGDILPLTQMQLVSVLPAGSFLPDQESVKARAVIDKESAISKYTLSELVSYSIDLEHHDFESNSSSPAVPRSSRGGPPSRGRLQTRFREGG